MGLFMNDALALRAAAILHRMTGDQCRVIMYRSLYRVVRVDPSGKEVVQS